MYIFCTFIFGLWLYFSAQLSLEIEVWRTSDFLAEPNSPYWLAYLVSASFLSVVEQMVPRCLPSVTSVTTFFST